MNRRLHRAHLPLARLLQPLSFSSPLQKPNSCNRTVATEHRTVATKPHSQINQKNVYGQTPLMLACKACAPACVRMLLGAGADATLFDGVQQRNALHYAGGCWSCRLGGSWLRRADGTSIAHSSLRSAACLNCAPPHPAAALYGCAEAVDALLDDDSLVATAAGQPRQLLRDALLADSQGHHRWGTIEFASAYFTVVRKPVPQRAAGRQPGPPQAGEHPACGWSCRCVVAAAATQRQARPPLLCCCTTYCLVPLPTLSTGASAHKQAWSP